MLVWVRAFPPFRKVRERMGHPVLWRSLGKAVLRRAVPQNDSALGDSDWIKDSGAEAFSIFGWISPG
jgi:hypothetical protein